MFKFLKQKFLLLFFILLVLFFNISCTPKYGCDYKGNHTPKFNSKIVQTRLLQIVKHSPGRAILKLQTPDTVVYGYYRYFAGFKKKKFFINQSFSIIWNRADTSSFRKAIICEECKPCS